MIYTHLGNKNTIKEYKYNVDGETWTVYKWNGGIVHMSISNNSDFNSNKSEKKEDNILGKESYFDF